MVQPVYTPPPQPGPLPDGKRVYVSTDHDGHYSVGVASVVIAHSEAQARGLLDAELKAKGLSPAYAYTLQEVNADQPVAVILNDGNY